MPGSEAVSTLHWPKNDILSFFKILQKKVPGLTKKLMHISCKLQKSSFNKCRKFLLSRRESFWVICPWNKFEEKAQCEAVLYYTNLHDKDFFTSKMPLRYLIKLTPVRILSSWTAVHLNKYKTVPCFCQLSQNVTTDCVLISVFYLFLPGSIKNSFRFTTVKNM